MGNYEEMRILTPGVQENLDILELGEQAMSLVVKTKLNPTGGQGKENSKKEKV